MTAIGALPNLEALKLRHEAFSGSSWETVEGEFPKLVFLLLEEMSFTRWDTADSHFPVLKRLIIRSCVMIEEIPSRIGDIPTLEKIQLDYCRPSAVASDKERKSYLYGNTASLLPKRELFVWKHGLIVAKERAICMETRPHCCQRESYLYGNTASLLPKRELFVWKHGLIVVAKEFFEWKHGLTEGNNMNDI